MLESEFGINRIELLVSRTSFRIDYELSCFFVSRACLISHGICTSRKYEITSVTANFYWNCRPNWSR